MITGLPSLLYGLLGTVVLVLAAGPVLLRRKWRRGLRQRLGLSPLPAWAASGEMCIWIHGSSVGEVVAASGLIARIVKDFPECNLVISSFTVTGRDVARAHYRHLGERVHCTLLPLDWNGVPARVLEHYRPALFVILETELWPNLLKALKQSGCPLILANGRISKRSFKRYILFRGLAGTILEAFTAVCVRTEEDGHRFERLGVPKGLITQSGNLKHDGVEERKKAGILRRKVFGDGDGLCFLAGSLRKGEPEIVLEAFRELRKRFPGLILVMAPRHPDRFDDTLLDREGYSWIRWSQTPPGGPPAHTGCILVDTLGELAPLYGLASVAFVGGSLVSRGGHNLMEPATRGVPVLFGPDFANFNVEGKALLETGGGIMVNDGRELIETAAALLASPDHRESVGERAAAAAVTLGGAVEQTMTVIHDVLRGER